MVEAILVFLGGLLTSEVYQSLPGVARWIVSRHVAKLPAPGLRARMQEEWAADLERIDGHIHKVLFALDLHRGLGELVKEHRPNKHFVSAELKIAVPTVVVEAKIYPPTVTVEAVGTARRSSNALGMSGSARVTVNAVGTFGYPTELDIIYGRGSSNVNEGAS